MNSASITPNIQADQRNGNLHIKLFGNFCQNTALLLSRTIRQQYRGKGNIFINTEKVEMVLPTGQSCHRKNLQDAGLPAEHIYLIGKKGFEIGTQGSKVIVKKKKKCCGKCKNCSCQKNGITKQQGKGD